MTRILHGQMSQATHAEQSDGLIRVELRFANGALVVDDKIAHDRILLVQPESIVK
jgi:hypothetical protein